MGNGGENVPNSLLVIFDVVQTYPAWQKKNSN